VQKLYDVIAAVGCVVSDEDKESVYALAFSHCRRLLFKRLGLFAAPTEGLHRVAAANFGIVTPITDSSTPNPEKNIFFRFGVDIIETPLNCAKLKAYSLSICHSNDSGATRSFSDDISEFILTESVGNDAYFGRGKNKKSILESFTVNSNQTRLDELRGKFQGIQKRAAKFVLLETSGTFQCILSDHMDDKSSDKKSSQAKLEEITNTLDKRMKMTFFPIGNNATLKHLHRGLQSFLSAVTLFIGIGYCSMGPDLRDLFSDMDNCYKILQAFSQVYKLYSKIVVNEEHGTEKHESRGGNKSTPIVKESLYELVKFKVFIESFLKVMEECVEEFKLNNLPEYLKEYETYGKGIISGDKDPGLAFEFDKFFATRLGSKTEDNDKKPAKRYKFSFPKLDVKLLDECAFDNERDARLFTKDYYKKVSEQALVIANQTDYKKQKTLHDNFGHLVGINVPKIADQLPQKSKDHILEIIDLTADDESVGEELGDGVDIRVPRQNA
jgi:hypothetical protein